MFWRSLLAVLFIFPFLTTRDIAPVTAIKPKTGNAGLDFTWSSLYSKINIPTSLPWKTNKRSNIIDTAALKQSDWYSTVLKNIEESEYAIIKGSSRDHYIANNQQQQLKTSFNDNGFVLQPLDEKHSWRLNMKISGIFTGNKIFTYTAKQDLPVPGSNKIVFGNEDLSTEYINSKEGIRQNFIIRKKPSIACSTISIRLSINKGWYINKVHDKELHLARVQGDQLSNKVVYNSLKAWDANNKDLDARFLVNKDHTGFEIEVNSSDAVYPVTIDPLSTSPSTTLNGTSSGDYFGNSVSSAGDVNGDGYSDVIIGSPGVSTNTGKVFLFLGSATGLSASPSVTLNGTSTGDHFGYSVASAGDVNNDGYSDVIIGAYGVSSSKGAAYVFLGSAAGLSASPATTLNGVGSGDLFGWSVAGAGDVNGDGYSDVIVGAWDVGTFRGSTYIFLGSNAGLSATAATTMTGTSVEDRFGWSVACAGDVNGDGYSDVIVGLWGTGPLTGQGKAFVFLGSSSGISTSPSTILAGLNGGDGFGYSVSSAGDVNGDGYSDVIVGAPGVSSNKGAAYLFLGSSSGLSTTAAVTLNGISTGDDFGFSVACAGDVNGDGYADVLVGAQVVAPSSTGAAYLFAGSSTGLSATATTTLSGLSSSGSFGNSVASAGDINGDGYSDLIVGAPNLTTNTGAAYTYHGSTNGINATAVWTVESNQAGAELGFHIASIASAGDVNGDGYGDVILGAPYYDNGQTDEGMVFVYYGSASGLPATASWTAESNQASAYFGVSVASAGDVNGDGYGDIIIGSSGYDNGETDEGRAFVYYGSASGLPASPNWTAESNIASAAFGWCVASAGDVNGDGYGDVIIGALMYSNGLANQGRAYAFYGSASGLSAAPNWTFESNQANAYLGHSVASAGDVNGDGYDDVIVGAHFYTQGFSQEGKAYVFYGSSSGLSATPSWTAVGNSASAGFGVRVACAGDVNGDGYSDVIIGSHTYNNGSGNVGRALVYYGSATGLPATASWTVNGPQAGDFFGIVSSAGDVNGDGYSDVLVGAFDYSNGQTGEGAAYVYYGSAAGLSATANWSFESNVVNAYLGYSVGCAGDVNGDGYSDILVGAPLYTNGETSEGKVFLFYGNANGGLRNNLRLYNTDLTTPIQQSNALVPNLFGAGLFAKSPLGRTKGKLVWEVKSQGNAFSGNPITNSTAYLDKDPSFTDLGIAGKELKSDVQKLGLQNKIRARVQYDKVTAITGQMYGPWRYPPAYLQGAYGMNSVPLPITLSYFTGNLRSGKVNLQWQNSNDADTKEYHIERSDDDRTFTEIGALNSSHRDGYTYSFADPQPLPETSWYRLRIEGENNQVVYSQTIIIRNKITAVNVYPTVIKKGGSITLQFNEPVAGTTTINIFNTAGALVYKKPLGSAGAGSSVIIGLPELAAGHYVLQLLQNNESLLVKKILIQ